MSPLRISGVENMGFPICVWNKFLSRIDVLVDLMVIKFGIHNVIIGCAISMFVQCLLAMINVRFAPVSVIAVSRLSVDKVVRLVLFVLVRKYAWLFYA